MLPGLGFSEVIVIYFISLFAIGFFFLIRDILRKNKVHHGRKSKESWVNFCLLIWSLVMILFITQQIFAEPWSQLPQPWNKVALGFSIQIIILIFIILSARYYPRLFDFPVNTKTFSLINNITTGITSFLAAIPLVFMVALSWNLVTKLWSYFGITIPLHKQELVELFTHSQSKLVIATIIIFATIIAPITEEFIFRAGIYRFLKSKMNTILALTCSSLLFAWVHYNIISFLPLVLLGLLLTRSYEKTGHIITPIIFHSLFNANTLILLLLDPKLNLIS